VYSYVSCCVEDTREIARQFAGTLTFPSTVLLKGDLGTGKTAFAQGLIAAFGVAEPVASPTFTLVNTYKGLASGGEKINLHHFDIYRINDPEELYAIGWDEYFEDDCICLVEWPERAFGYFPENTYLVELSRTDEEGDTRKIEITKNCDNEDI
jgi:tRNA threonylcarbamoyladenosine biosynthesis protein TsaE